MANERKSVQLGMNYGTACHRLRRMVLFDLLQRYGENICCRCGHEIVSIEDLSMDHVEPWQDNDPSLFWDLDNIAWAHKTCNYRASRSCTAAGQPRPDLRGRGHGLSSVAGVTYKSLHRGRKKWRAYQIYLDDSYHHVGYYATEQEAAEALAKAGGHRPEGWKTDG